MCLQRSKFLLLAIVKWSSYLLVFHINCFLPTPSHDAIPKTHNHLTIKTEDGTKPASFNVLDISSTPSNVFLGNVVEKLVTAFPVSLSTACASSNRVVSAGSVFMMLPDAVCSRSLASLWFALGFGAAGAAAATGAAAAVSGALPSRAALASSALRRRSALSASILALMRFLASMSSSFSWRLRAASLICSLR